jgi:hypothetical protein
MNLSGSPACPDGPCIQSASIKIRGWQPGGRQPFVSGAVAQLGERLICIQEVAGSIPTSSTSFEKPNGPVAQVARAHP